MANWSRLLDEYIAAQEERLTKAQQRHAELLTALRALEEARKVATGASAKAISELISQNSEKLHKAEQKTLELLYELKGAIGARDAAMSIGPRVGTSATRTRRISDEWRSILQFINTHGESGATLEGIQKFIEASKYEIKDSAVRSQLSIYSNKGFVVPLGGGNYRITAAGLALLTTENP